MKKWVILCALLLGGFLASYGQNNGNGNGGGPAGSNAGGNGSGNGNYGTNGAAGQVLPQSLVSQIAQKAAPLLLVTPGQIIHAYHVLECEIICLDPVLKMYRVSMGGNIGVIVLEDGF
jgi:hypothetical protein